MELTSYQQNFVGMIRDEDFKLHQINPKELAHLFVDASFLVTAMQFIQEQHWIHRKRHLQVETFEVDVKKMIQFELAPISFLESEINFSKVTEIAKIKNRAINIIGHVFAVAKGLSFPGNQIFAKQTIELISGLVHFEQQLTALKKNQNLHLGYSLERCFDDLDLVFNLDYEVDESIQASSYGNERIFEGSGIGVQSSYSTILLALQYLNLPQGTRFVDLGAGFGRVGFTIGLLRPDIEFIGYEIVEARVNVVNQSSKTFGLDRHVKFYTQDLSAKDFQIPEADVYYLFDPFSEETYKYVLGQLNALAQRKKIRIVTNGKARLMINSLVGNQLWDVSHVSDTGHFCVFNSKTCTNSKF